MGVVCSPLANNLQSPGTRTPIRLCDIHRRYTGLPLQKVKDWVLAWENEPERPFLLCDRNDLEQARARVQETPEMLRTYRALAETIPSTAPFQAGAKTMLWLALDDEQYAQAAVTALEQDITHCITTCWKEGGLIRLIIFDGRWMKVWMQAYDLLHAGGFIDAARDARIRRDLAFLAYCMADPELFPKHVNLADHNDPDSFYHGLGRTIGDAVCPPNFHTEYFTTYGMMGCCFPAHPQAAAWRQEAAQLMTRQLEVHFYDSGCYCESPNYHAHVFAMINQLALVLRRRGRRIFHQHPRFKAQFDYFCQMQTPPILLNETAQRFFIPSRFLHPGQDRYAMLPSNGNTGSDCSDMPLPMELVIGARIYQESDPALSARCMATWNNAGCPIGSYNNELSFLLLADPHLPASAQIGLRGSLLTGSYVTFRGNPETPDEVFVLTKNGTATHHNCFDEGGFTIWAYGAPIASDYGYHAEHAGRREGGINTWKHNCVEFDGKSSGYLGIEQTLPPEHRVSTPLADLLVSYLPITNLRDPQMTYMGRCRATHRVPALHALCETTLPVDLRQHLELCVHPSLVAARPGQ